MRFGSVFACCSLLSFVAGCGSSDSPGTAPAASSAPKSKVENSVTMTPQDMAAKEGVPIYPGAETPSGQSSITPGDAETKYEMVMLTPDPVAKVADYYNKAIPGIDEKKTAGGADFMGMTSSKIPVHIVVGSKEGKTTIDVVALIETNR